MPIKAIRNIGGVGAQGASGNAANPLQISGSLPVAVVGLSYSGTVSASGGTAPYNFTITAGSLPGGLSLNSSTGAITGTPTTSGSYTFTIQVTDASSHTATNNFSIQVNGGALQLSFSGSNASYGFPFNASLVATGGILSYTFSISSGSLPTGLSLNSTTGAVTGTPSAVGNFTFTGKVTDNASNTATLSCTIYVTYFDVPGASVASVTASETANSVYQDDVTQALHMTITVLPVLSSSLYPVRTRIWLDYDDGNGWTLQGDVFSDTSTPTFIIGGQQQTTGFIPPGTIYVPTDPSKVSWKVAAEANSHDGQPSGSAATFSFTVTAAGTPSSTDCYGPQFAGDPNNSNNLIDYTRDGTKWYWIPYELMWQQPTLATDPYYWFSFFTVQKGYEATGTGTVSAGNTLSSLSGITIASTDVGLDVHVNGVLTTIATVSVGANTFTVSGTLTNGAGQSVAIWRPAPDYEGADDMRGISPMPYRGRQVTDSGQLQGGHSVPGTWVQWFGGFPATWTMPSATNLDGSTNLYVTFRFRLYAVSRLASNSTGQSGVSVLQTTWATGDHYDLTPTVQPATLDLSQTNPVVSFAGPSPITGGNGLGLDVNVTGAMRKTSNSLDVALLGITNAYIANLAVQANNMAANAITYANAAIAANAIVDSNVATVQIGKLISGTVVFSGNIALARGNGQAVVTMDSTGIYLFSNCSASGSGVTPGVAGSPTYSATGTTANPYVGVTASQIGVFSGGSGPSVTTTGSAISLWSANGSTASPYGVIQSTGAWFYYSATVYATIQSTGFQAVNGSNTAQVNSSGLQAVSGNYTLQAYSTGIVLTYTPSSYSAQITSSGILLTAGTYTTQVYASGIKMVDGTGASLVLTGAGHTLYSTDGSTSTPYTTITTSSMTIAYSGTGPGTVASSTGVAVYSVLNSTGSPYALFEPTGIWVYYSATVYATVQSGGFEAVNGSNTAQVNSSGLLATSGSYSLQAYSTGIKLLFSGGPSTVLSSSTLTLYNVDGNTGFPYVQISSTAVTIFNASLTITNGVTTINLDITNCLKLHQTGGATVQATGNNIVVSNSGVGRTFTITPALMDIVDASLNEVQITPNSVSIWVLGSFNSGVSINSILYTKPGGATGTLTFTLGWLTAWT